MKVRKKKHYVTPNPSKQDQVNKVIKPRTVKPELVGGQNLN
jgi:hypothetical protein